MAAFSERLKQLRKEKNLTQLELANKTGVNRVTYTNWENGNREPSLDKIVELAANLNCTIDYLLGESNINPFEVLENIDNVQNTSKDELEPLIKMFAQNIALITEIAKIKFNCSDEEVKDIISTIAQEINSNKEDL